MDPSWVTCWSPPRRWNRSWSVPKRPSPTRHFCREDTTSEGGFFCRRPIGMLHSYICFNPVDPGSQLIQNYVVYVYIVDIQLLGNFFYAVYTYSCCQIFILLYPVFEIFAIYPESRQVFKMHLAHERNTAGPSPSEDTVNMAQVNAFCPPKNMNITPPWNLA